MEGENDAQSRNAAAPTLRGGLTPEASRLFRVYKTVSKMLSKRGYMVPREMREMTPGAFSDKFGDYPSREALTILVVRPFVETTILSILMYLNNNVAID